MIGAVFLSAILPLAPVLSPVAMQELMPLASETASIFMRATARQARHRAALRARGVAEVAPNANEVHTLSLAGLGRFSLNDRGEIALDRRFVTDSELKTLEALERWIAKYFPGEAKKAAVNRPAKSPALLPVFRGFEDARYQEYDALIVRLTAEFNRRKAQACGGTAAQAARIEDLKPALVKSHLIEESGGNSAKSRAAWAVDPLQVNVPGDWGDEKTLVGLTKPAKRNEGTAEANIRAALCYLSRKGFSPSARPAAERPKGYFDGWKVALQRYNGRRDRTDTDRYYSDEYADKILRRAADPNRFVPIEIKLAQ